VKSEKLNSWLALGANVGVLIGLVVLIFELGQNTDMMRVQMLDSRLQSQADRRAETYSDDLLEVRARLGEKGLCLITKDQVSELTAYESMVMSEWFAVQLLSNANNFYQCQEGFLDDESCTSTFKSDNGQIQYLILGMHAVDRGMLGHRPSFIAEIRRLSEEAGLPVIGEDGRWD
jgi:hypothetical protein